MSGDELPALLINRRVSAAPGLGLAGESVQVKWTGAGRDESRSVVQSNGYVFVLLDRHCRLALDGVISSDPGRGLRVRRWVSPNAFC